MKIYNTVRLADEEEKIMKIFENNIHQVSKKVKHKSIELSEREKEVLKLLIIGHSNKEIADHLHMSVHTVISHRKNIVKKLGIKSVAGLTVYAIINKMIDPENIHLTDLI